MTEQQHRQTGDSFEEAHSGYQRQSGNAQRKRVRWILMILGLVFLIILLRDTVNPYGDQEYIEIPHGDHSHFVPKDRDPDVSISNFPSSPPGPNERILPDGRVVPR